jgi:ribosomal protein L37AE/L43A
MAELVTIARYRDLPEAWIAKGKLESAGIPCFVADDNMARMNWFYGNAIGGIRLQVGSEYVSTARELLKESVPEKLPSPGDTSYVQPRCPRCDSLEVRRITLNPFSYFLLLIGIPIPIPAKHWECEDCGATWKWEGPGEYDDQRAASPPHV